jgi:peptidoglycan/LPS O-acetylase OafA/YrhL
VISQPIRIDSASNSQAQLATGERIPALDALRGLAVLAVMLFHFGGGLEGPAYSGTQVLPAIHLGARGVNLFFVLSGFLITGVLFDAKGQRHYFRNFLAKRALRIFPLYYLVLFLSFVVLPFLSGGATWQAQADAESAWLWAYCPNLVLAWRGKWCLGAFDHFWSLGVEEQFYLVWPFAICLLSRRKAMLACCIIFCAAVVGRFAWTTAGGNDVARYTLPWFRMDALAAGAWLALLVRGPTGWAQLIKPSWVLLAACCLGMIGLGLANLRFAPLNDTIWTLAFTCSLVLLVEAHPGSWLGAVARFPVLHWFAHYSYGIYVLSNLLIWILAPILTAKGLGLTLQNIWLGQCCYLLVMIILTSAVAVVSWHLFEGPILKWKRYFVEPPAFNRPHLSPVDPPNGRSKSGTRESKREEAIHG